MKNTEQKRSKIQAIEYQPWKQENRTSFYQRILAISSRVVKEKLFKSKAVKILLLIGLILFQAFPILTNVLVPHTTYPPEAVIGQQFSSYLQNVGYWIFLMLFVSVLTADVIAKDIHSHSFDLYFSRPITPSDYFAGKFFGVLSITSAYCLLPLIGFGIAMIGTQTGTDYIASFTVLGRTIIAGVFVSVYFLPFSLMFSSLTQRKAYAGIGSFVTFFILFIVGGIFSQFDPDWRLLNPRLLGLFALNLIMGLEFPETITPIYFALGLTTFLLLPLCIVYIQLYRVSVQ